MSAAAQQQAWHPLAPQLELEDQPDFLPHLTFTAPIPHLLPHLKKLTHSVCLKVAMCKCLFLSLF